jgi:hypothetical protein
VCHICIKPTGHVCHQTTLQPLSVWPKLRAASPVHHHCVAVTMALLHPPCARRISLASDALMHMLCDPRSTQSPCTCSTSCTPSCMQGRHYMPSMQRITSLNWLTSADRVSMPHAASLSKLHGHASMCAYRFCTQARLVNRRQSQ